MIKGRCSKHHAKFSLKYRWRRLNVASKKFGDVPLSAWGIFGL